MDYRSTLNPASPYLLMLDPMKRKVVELCVTGHTRAEIAAMTRKSEHCVAVTLGRAMETLGCRTGGRDGVAMVQLTLLAYGLIDAGAAFGTVFEEWRPKSPGRRRRSVPMEA